MTRKWLTPAMTNRAAKTRLPTRYQSFSRFAISTVFNSGRLPGMIPPMASTNSRTSRSKRSRTGRSRRTEAQFSPPASWPDRIDQPAENLIDATSHGPAIVRVDARDRISPIPTNAANVQSVSPA